MKAHPLKVTILVCACGDEEWSELAFERAWPSTEGQGGGTERLFAYTQNATISEVRNEAAKKASGDWLCFLDADDTLAPDFLAGMRQAFKRMQMELAATLTSEASLEAFFNATDWIKPILFAPSVQYRTADGEPIGRPHTPNEGRWPELNECVIGTLIGRPMFERLGGFDESLPSLEDYDLFLRAHDAGAQIVHVPEAVYNAWSNPMPRNRDQSPYSRIWQSHLERS